MADKLGFALASLSWESILVLVLMGLRIVLTSLDPVARLFCQDLLIVLWLPLLAAMQAPPCLAPVATRRAAGVLLHWPSAPVWVPTSGNGTLSWRKVSKRQASRVSKHHSQIYLRTCYLKGKA